MTDTTRDRVEPPKPPSYRHLLAVALELSIVATFAAEKSYVGLSLCIAYAWFSATWAAFVGTKD